MYRCPKCHSVEVQVSYPIWIPANNPDKVDAANVDWEAQPHKDSDKGWCPTCNDTILVEDVHAETRARFCCSKCGSADVQIVMWTYADKDIEVGGAAYAKLSDAGVAVGDPWCDACNSETSISSFFEFHGSFYRHADLSGMAFATLRDAWEWRRPQ